MAPIKDPIVAKMMIKKMFKSVFLLIKPENERITSDGIGGIKFSKAIRKVIPK